MMTYAMQIAEEIIAGRRLTIEDDLEFLKSGDLQELTEAADHIREALCGNYVDLCTIINGRGGRCSENCKFCAQSAHYHTGCKEYPYLDTETILEDCAKVHAHGVDRYSIVTAGRTVAGEDLRKTIQAYKALHEAFPEMILCASHGLMEEADLEELVKVGVTVYHANVETASTYFPEICTTHTYADKLEEIRRAKAAGLSICCGGILGMGETIEDRIRMAAEIAEIGVDSIPLNFLVPMKGTPLEHVERLREEEIMRSVAIFRFLNPVSAVRLAAGRNYLADDGKCLLRGGANATITGDMLTTVGNNTEEDRKMLTEMGFAIHAKPEKRNLTDER